LFTTTCNEPTFEVMHSTTGVVEVQVEIALADCGVNAIRLRARAKAEAFTE